MSSTGILFLILGILLLICNIISIILFNKDPEVINHYADGWRIAFSVFFIVFGITYLVVRLYHRIRYGKTSSKK